MTLGWALPGGGLVQTVNGIAPDGGGDVALAATDIPYTPTFAGASSATTVGGQLEYGENHIGPAGVWWSEEVLEDLAPLAAGEYPLTVPTLAVAPAAGSIVITAGRKITGTFPASIEAVGGDVAIEGDVDDSFISGEFSSLRKVILRNDSVGASSMAMSVGSLTGRLVKLNDVTLVGKNLGEVKDATGIAIGRTILLQPTVDGGTGLEFEGTIGSTFFDVIGSFAPGTTAWTGIASSLTTTVTGTQTFANILMQSQLAADALCAFSPLMTYPASDVLTVTGGEVTGPGTLFDPASLTQASEVIASFGNINAASSQYIASATFAGGATPILLAQTGAPDVVPAENAGPAATLTASALNQHSTLNITAPTAPADWDLEMEPSRINNLSGNVAWTLTASKSGGADRTLTVSVEVDTGGGFVPIPEASASDVITNSAMTLSGNAPIAFDSGHKFRLLTDSTVATTTSISFYTLSVQGSP